MSSNINDNNCQRRRYKQGSVDRKLRPPNLTLTNFMEIGRRGGHKKPNSSVYKKEEWKDFKEWRIVSDNMTEVFHGHRLSPKMFERIHEIVRAISKSEVGGLVAESYNESILKKGMVILREQVKEKSGKSLLSKLSETWTKFYSNILPTLLAIFYPISTHHLTIRQMTLVAFRDIVLLKTKINDALVHHQPAPSSVQQMLLVLQSVHDFPINESYTKLEALTAIVICPYLGAKKVYLNNNSNNNNNDIKDLDLESTSNFSGSDGNLSIGSPSDTPVQRRHMPSRPMSMVSAGSSYESSELEHLMQLRKQRYRYSYGGQQLDSLKEGAISSSLASLMADGFEIAP